MSNFKADIQEIMILIHAVEIAINNKVYTKEQIDKIFPIWNNMTSNLQKVQRQNAVDQLYPAVEVKKAIEVKESEDFKDVKDAILVTDVTEEE